MPEKSHFDNVLYFNAKKIRLSCLCDFFYFREFDDSSTCWHGGGIYEDCNNKLWTRNMIIRHRGGNCKWWHFYPDERYDKLEAKFNEIIGGNQETGIMNNLISMARKVELNNFGKVFGP